jgi:GR25 family glycosyltransferase involved in LPS biosynthesis
VISLKSYKQILPLLNKIKNEYNLNPVYIEGVNGKKLTYNEIKKNTSSLYAQFGPKSAIGCAMAHIKTWKQFLSTTDEMCIIFEDDVVFEPNFSKKLKVIIDNLPKDFDLVFLGCASCQSNNNKKINKYFNKPAIATGTHAYIISRKGAEILLYYIDKKINNHIDRIIMTLYDDNKIVLYSLNNLIAYQTSASTGNSANISKYPFLINKICSFFEVEKTIKLDYTINVSNTRIGSFNISTMTYIFFAIGIVLSICRVNIRISSLIFLIISLPDILIMKYLDIVLFYYLVFIIPSLISQNF